MTPNPSQPRSQEQSIRARKHQLFESDEHPDLAGGPRRPFKECLKTTPANPLSPAIKGLLWVVGSLVILLLAAALVTSSHKKPRPAKPVAGLGDEAGRAFGGLQASSRA